MLLVNLTFVLNSPDTIDALGKKCKKSVVLPKYHSKCGSVLLLENPKGNNWPCTLWTLQSVQYVCDLLGEQTSLVSHPFTPAANILVIFSSSTHYSHRINEGINRQLFLLANFFQIHSRIAIKTLTQHPQLPVTHPT